MLLLSLVSSESVGATILIFTDGLGVGGGGGGGASVVSSSSASVSTAAFAKTAMLLDKNTTVVVGGDGGGGAWSDRAKGSEAFEDVAVLEPKMCA